MNKLEKANWIDRRRKAHHAALATLATGKERDGLKLWRKLRKVEAEAHGGATAYCNGDVFTVERLNYARLRVFDFNHDDNAWEHFSIYIKSEVKAVLGNVPLGFFVNGDARGYALKLDNDVVNIPVGMETDLGGCGILAATIE